MILANASFVCNLACPALPSGPVAKPLISLSNLLFKPCKNSLTNLVTSDSNACPERIGKFACAL